MDGCGMVGGRFAYSLLPKLDKNVPVNVDKFKCDSQLSLVNKRLQEFYRDQQFCDVTLVAGMDGVKVEAHRVILASSSDYFCAMFGGSLSESRSKEAYLDQIDGVTLQAVVDFMYFGTLEIRRDNVENILTASSLFNLEKVAERGSQFMINHLDSSNCLGIALYAEQYNYFLLYRHAYAKVCDCFTELPEEDEFHMLNVEQFCKFLKSDDLCVESEEDVFRVVIKWVEHDREDREQYIARLFGLIRFYRISPSFIDSEVIPEYNASECLDVIAKSRKERLQSKYSRNRNPKKKLTYISVWFTDENVLSAEVYNPVLNCWKYQEWPEKPNNRSVFKTAVLGNELIFAGGRTEYFCPSNIVDALDVKTMKWRELPSMLSPRHLFALVALDGKLYAVGGRGDDGVLQSVERYDPETNKWEYVASTLERHAEHAAVALSGKLYVLGGSHSFECYSPETDTWTRKAPMKSSASPATMAVVNETLFAISSQDCKLQRYEATTNVWVDISTLGGNIKNIECCGFGDTLIISVGNSLVMSYNILTEVWSTLPPYERLCGKGVLVSI